jgi:hypothetical protein
MEKQRMMKEKGIKKVSGANQFLSDRSKRTKEQKEYL